MLSKTQARELIDEVFEKEALVVGGLVAVGEIDDDLVWRLIRSLDVIRTRALRSLDDREPAHDPDGGPPVLEPHPAVEDFLQKIRSS